MNAGGLDFLTCGEAMALLAAPDPGPLHEAARFERHSAGAELNVAIGMARLGFRAGYLSRVGDDAWGRYLVGVLQREGIDDSLLALDPARPTGFMAKSRASSGEDPQVEYFRRGSAASAMDPADLERLGGRDARHLHLTGILAALSPGCLGLAESLLAHARARGMRVSFDPNLRPRLWRSQEEMRATTQRLACQADLVLPGLAEGRLLTGREDACDIARHYLDAGVRQVVVKLGPAGAWYASAEGESGEVPACRVDAVVDTVGAGDGFAVGVISALLDGRSLHDAAARGNAIGARVVGFPGDNDGLPTRAQLPAGT